MTFHIYHHANLHIRVIPKGWEPSINDVPKFSNFLTFPLPQSLQLVMSGKSPQITNFITTLTFQIGNVIYGWHLTYQICQKRKNGTLVVKCTVMTLSWKMIFTCLLGGVQKLRWQKKGINVHFTYEGLLLLGKLVHQGRGEDEKVQNRVHVVFERPYLLM